MAYVEPVAVGETRDHLTKYANGFRFGKTAVFNYMVKELAALNEFQDEVSLSSGQSVRFNRDAVIADSQFTPILPDIIQTNDVRMLD